MHSTLGKRTLLWAGILALVAAMALPSDAGAVPERGAKGRGFRLFARSLGALTINRIYCGLNSVGEVCVDSTNSSTIGGGYWPKGTADQYIFNSGLQLAGIIGADGGPWAGDTTGAFFFDPKGTTVHGTEVRPIYNAANVDDAGNWPAEGRVPIGDTQADFFNPLLQGRVSASQGDIWYITWEGDPGLNAGRPHPLGILSEVRGMGWNYPTGNEDILYFIYTFYNVTSLNAGDYAAARPEMQDILIQQAQQFHTRNNSAFGVTLPTGGYTIENLFAAFSRDDDVGDAGSNYSSVNLPFALGFTYEATFDGPGHAANLGWTFDPTGSTFLPPFFAGPGFTAAKYLASPTGAGEIQLFSNTINGGAFNDAQNTTQLYRYLSGNISPAAGDEPCTYTPSTDRVCYINEVSAQDMRFFQSSTPLTLGPGEFGHIVVAYIHAAPVALPAFTGSPTADVKPGDPRRLVNPAQLALGANMIDSLMGFISWDDLNTNGIVEQTEFTLVPGSMLAKSLVAQTIFDNKFLLPFAPEAPAFFLVPGDNEVTVLWQPSETETVGDPFYQLASSPLEPDLEVNPLYDPNYRQNDVEGYRVYRGRVDNPTELQMIASFDYDGTTFDDYFGTVNPTPGCAPELGIQDDCPVTFDTPVPGDPYVAHATYPITSPFIQSASRVELADGTTLVTSADTAATGGASGGFPSLEDTAVPFQFVDRNVRNGFRYFYSVTAFDVNSLRSGPSSLESTRATRGITPSKDASNYVAEGSVSVEMLGRGTVLNTDAAFPTMDGATGTFSGPMPPARTWTLGFTTLLAKMLQGDGGFSLIFDSITPGSSYAAHQSIYWFTVSETGATVSLPLTQPPTEGTTSGSVAFVAGELDPDAVARYGGTGTYPVSADLGMELSGTYFAGGYGRGCVNGALFGPGGNGFGFAVAGSRNCAYNGSRWFDGPSPANNETVAHPIAANTANFSGVPQDPEMTNGGYLTGVEQIFQPQSYHSASTTWRQVEGMFSSVRRSADFNVYWGAGGLVDSVIDVTHNVVVPFRADYAASSWGILNQSAAQPSGAGVSYDQRTELTVTDLTCVEPLRSDGGGGAASHAPCGTGPGSGPVYALSQTAVPGPIAFMNGMSTASVRTIAAQANNGIVMYIAGNVFGFELTGGAVPAAGSVWTLRDYVGAIAGGGCPTCGAGENGPYIFTPFLIQPLTATGVELRATYSITNEALATVPANLASVHTVPDPYYVTNQYEQTTDNKIIKFVNLPQQAIIRIYSASGVLVDVIEHNSDLFSGEANWNVRNRNNQVVASGVYFYHIESGEARKVGRFTVVNFAQ